MKHIYLCKIFLLLFIIINCCTSFSQTLPTGFSFTNVGSGWNEPVGTAFSKDGKKLFVWQKNGQVFVCNYNAVTKAYDKQVTAVLDISEEVGDWRDHGLLGFAIDPNYDVNNLIYLLYVVDRHYLTKFGTSQYSTTTNEYFAATIGRITRYKTKLNSSSQLVADLTTRTILLGESKSTGLPILHESHGVGTLTFAADGTLLASCGDGASYNEADMGSAADTYYAQALTDGIIRSNENVGALRSQMVNSFSGKILRLDPTNGNGVASNPFYSSSSPRSAKSRVWAMGFRNPFRFSVKPNTGSTNPAVGDIGEIYVGDVGWNTYEELNIIDEPAANCGWPLFEGLNIMSTYAVTPVANKDEPNPLYGINGCPQQYFTFNNLIKQATADNNHTVYNPCNSSVAISSENNNRFFHHLPSLDWKHGIDSARVGIFLTNNVSVAQIGSANSEVTGIPFRGNASVGGCWYDGNMFPVQYKNTYFQADYGGTWIKNMVTQFVDKVTSVNDFSSGFGAIVHLTQNPLDGSIFCVDLGTSSIKRISFGGNQPPIVVMSSNKTFGPAPLSVSFTGNTSHDPEGGRITYSWNFGDGSALNTTANPSHTFTTGNNLPKKFVVTLTVKDSVNATAVDSIIISANNTPPHVNITSPVKNTYYNVGTDTMYLLRATVTDAEQTAGQLFYTWQTILRHNNHEHPEPLDTNKNTSSTISRIGCNGDTYYYIIKLKVTDAAGLSTMDSTKLFPSCGVLQIVSIKSGAWDDPATWSCNCVPRDHDDVTIKATHTVTIIPSMGVLQCGKLKLETGSNMNVSGNYFKLVK